MNLVTTFAVLLTIHMSTGFFLDKGPCYLYVDFPMSPNGRPFTKLSRSSCDTENGGKLAKPLVNHYDHFSGIPPPNATLQMTLPNTCKNGTFYWDYPSGHVYLHYNNEQLRDTKICFSDDLGGSIYSVFDLSNDVKYELPHFMWDSDTKVCTHTDSMKDILLRIDAPEQQYYMGSMLYTVE